MKLRCFPAIAAVAMIMLCATSQARAQTPSVAQGLFEEAMTLMTAGNYAEACPKLAESHRLDPGGGTVFNLAICLEKEGKTASAYVAYDEALARAVKDANRERETHARERLAQLKPLLSKLVIQVHPKNASLEGLELRFDGEKLRPEAWGTRVPVDPGAHTLTAAATNHADFRQEVKIDEPGKVYAIDVPELAPTAISTPPQKQISKNDDGSTPTTSRDGRRSTLAYVLLATGGAFVVGGAVSGALAVSSHADSNTECPNGPTSCTRAGVRAEEAATRWAWGANIGIGLGLVAVGVGVYLLLTNPTRPTAGPTAQQSQQSLQNQFAIAF